MGRADLIGNGKRHLVPSYQPAGTAPAAPGKPRSGVPAAAAPQKAAAPRRGTLLTQHTGLPPRETGAARKPPGGARAGGGRKGR